MSDFKAKMHQIRFWLELCPRPRWGAYTAPQDLLAALRGPTSNGRGRREGESLTSAGGIKDPNAARSFCQPTI